MTIASSLKSPGIFLEVLFGVGAASAADAPIDVLIVGHQLPTATATANTVFAANSADDVADVCGAGSEIHLMAKAAFKANPGVTLYALPLAEPGGGTAADEEIVFSGTASADGTVTVLIRGESIEVAIPSGTTAAAAAALVETAIEDQTDWPVTASVATATLTITAKTKGTRGNNITCGSSGTVAGLTITHIAGTKLSGGAGSDTITTAIANITVATYDRIALAFDDATTLGTVRTHLRTQAGPTIGSRQQAIFASVDTYANVVSLATGRNESRMQCVWHYNADDTPAEVAAAVAAHRANEESIDRAHPFSVQHGDVIVGLRPQRTEADWPTSTELAHALNNGVTPLQVLADGTVGMHRGITTRSLDALSNPNYAVLDTSKVTVCDFIADELAVNWGAFVSENQKLSSTEDPDELVPGVTNLAGVKSWVMGILEKWDPEYLDAVSEDDVTCTRATSPAGRVRSVIELRPVDGLYQNDTTIRQTA